MTQKPWLRSVLVVAAPLFLLSSARDGRAQTSAAVPNDSSINTQLFQQAIGAHNFLTVDGAEVPEHKQLWFGLSLNYQRRPFSKVVMVSGFDPVTTAIVEHQLTGELAAAMGLFERVQVGLALPFTPVLKGDLVDMMGSPTGQQQTASGIGDLRVEAKAQLATLGPDDQITIGAMAGLTVPTAKLAGPSLSTPVDNAGSYYLGEKNFTGRIKALGGLQLGKLRAAANLGILLRQSSHAAATVVGHQLLYGAAAAYEVRRRIELMIELSGRSGLDNFIEFFRDVNPFEVDAAVRIGVTSMWSITAGGGRGIGKGVGAPAGRGFVGAAFAPDFRDRDHDGVYDVDDKCPDQPEDRDGFQDGDGCPELDNDNDGIPDAQDKCPNDAEDLDQFQDEDGCPELDNDKDGIPDLNDACPNAAEDGRGKRPKDGCPSTSEDSDGDGIPDAMDKCPDEPEDRDGFQDDDGCPDPDNDADGIPDNFDNCPNEAEDPDGFEDEDGCPEPDNDKDGFPDAQDKCPLQPETLNGNKDDDGCPDPGAPTVRLGTGRIEVDERIGFVTKGGKAVVRENAVQALGLVALLLKGHTEIAKVRIEVRAEGVAKEETQRRADAIREVLVSKGVAAERLVAMGMGSGGGAHVDFLVDSVAGPPKPPAKGGGASKAGPETQP
jgi:OOP family OmpA-OmpF porin